MNFSESVVDSVPAIGKKIFVSLHKHIALMMCLLISLFTMSSSVYAVTQAPKVVASIPPFAMLSQQLLGAKGDVHLISQQGSPHHRILKPSDVKELATADAVVWVGDALEQYLGRFESRYQSKMFAMLDNVSEANVIHTGGHDDHHGHDHHHHDHKTNVDPHIWLSKDAIIEFAGVLLERFSTISPDNRGYYQQNFNELVVSLKDADKAWQQSLPEEVLPFFVYHDAYSYLGRDTGLQPMAILTVNPGVKPSAAKLRKLTKQLAGIDRACVFFEPEFQKVRLDNLSDAQLHYTLLDPVASQLDWQRTDYRSFLDSLVNEMAGCLKQN